MRALFLALCVAPSALAQDWVPLQPDNLGSIANGLEASHVADGVLLFTGAAEVDRYQLSLPTELEGITALRLEVLPHESLPQRGPGRANNGNFVLSEVQLTSRVGRTPRPVELASATASFSQVGWPVRAAIDGRDETGWAISGNTGKEIEAVFNLAEPLGKGRRTLELALSFHFGQLHSIGCLRVSVTTASGVVNAAGVSEGLSKLELAINGAIDRGVGYLSDEQDLDGSWPGDRDHYKVGGTALNVYALVKSGLSPNHQSVRRALAYIDANPPQKTYEAGCVLMLYATLDHEVYRDRARAVLADLMDWQVSDWGYPGGHGDPNAGHVDLSNTQYGALGYWAAGKLGLEVPQVAWKRLAEAALRYQRADGGFGYTPGAPSKGSMSAAGAAILALCIPNIEGGLKRECEVGLNQGLEWLNVNFQPTENTGAGSGWLLYYLYGIERVGAFADRDVFNGMNWYREGARQLIKEQEDRGNWAGDGRPLANTSFGLLFLNRASASVTGPGLARSSQKTYGADSAEVDINLRASGDTPLTVWVSSFGDKLLDGFTFEEERQHGPRVTRVEYLTTGGVLLADSRSGGATWQHATKAPEPGWERPGTELKKSWKQGPGAFGRPDSPQLAVGTGWEKDELWIVHDFQADPAAMVAPQLELSFSSSAAAGQRGPREPILKLFDEEVGFADLLTEGGAPIAVQAGGATGEQCLKVDAVQRHSPQIPGWSFKIREKPDEGEYRYLRFRWRKPKGGVMIQLAFEGGWQRAQRYHAGPNSVNFEPSLEVDRGGPEEWVTVTRDLWADHGDGLLTGIALTAMDGPAFFDGLYLARKKADLRKDAELVDGTPEWDTSRAGAYAGADALVVHLNGARVLSLDRETVGFQTVLAGEALRAALRPGTNRIAVHARNSEPGRALDLGLSDHRRLATIDGDGSKPSQGDRFAARVKFPRPGQYPLWARVHLLDGTDGEEIVFESTPMTVDIQEAFDPDLLSYASDADRNLLLDAEVTLSASTEFNGWPAARVADGRYDLAWLSADGDAQPRIEVTLRRPVKADTLLLSHTRSDRADAGRTTVPKRVAVVLNGKGDPIVAEVDPSRLRKTEIALPPGTKVRSFTVQVLVCTPLGHPSKSAVGFAELELQYRGR